MRCINLVPTVDLPCKVFLSCVPLAEHGIMLDDKQAKKREDDIDYFKMH
jgi:hypothetical protein